MVRPDAKGIHRVRKTLAGGREVEYHYAWRGGPRFWQSGSDVTRHGPGYWKAYRDALEEYDPSAGKFRQVIRNYLKSHEFQRLAERTQKDYSRSIYMKVGIDEKFGDAPLEVFNRPEIRRVVYDWRDSIASPRVADHLKTHLVKIVNWAVDRNYLATNHLAGMKARYEVDRSELIWTDDEITAFTAAAPPYLRRIMIAATETGLRPQDLCILSRGHIKDTPNGKRIVLRTQKRKRVVSIPITDRMEQLIDETPKDRLILLVGERGQPYRKSTSMGRQVHRLRQHINEKAEAQGIPLPIRPELHFYDCRGTAATRLFQADASLREIATHMGWSVQTAAKMIETYVSMHPESAEGLVLRLNAAL